MERRDDIQILRGAAVLLVVLYHLDIPLFASGFLGVDAFFVISGFLMAVLYKPGEVRGFYERRASRLLPAYFATIIITVAVSSFVTLPSDHSQVIEQGLFAAVFSSNIGFWLQNSYFSKAEFNPLLHLWSLGVEIQFYLIVPLLAWVHSRSRLTLLFLSLGSIGMAMLVVGISPKTAFFMMPTRLWQFMVGAGVAYYLTQGGSIRYRSPVVGGLLLCLLVGISIAYPVDGEAREVALGHPGLASLLVAFATGGVLAFGLPRLIEASRVGKALRIIGDWSYSIYLAHFPMIVLFLYQPFSGTVLSPGSITQTLSLVAGIGITSSLLYILFDRRRVWRFSLAGLTLIVAGTMAIIVVSVPLSKRGYEQSELNILNAFHDRAPYRCGKLVRILNPTDQLCELPHNLPADSPALMLIGDSHSDSIKTSFAKMASISGYRVLFAVSNTPLVGTPKTDEVLRLADKLDVAGIFLHFASSNALRAYETGFHRKAVNAGNKLVWLLPVPVFEDSIPAVLWSGRDKAGGQITPINLADVSELRNRLSSEGIPVFDFREALCPGVCSLVDEAMRPFYFDHSHLTLTGAERTERILAQALGWIAARSNETVHHTY